VADVLTAEEVGRILTYVAPGYFALYAFRAHFPQRNTGQLETLVLTVATSVPLVALANEIADRRDISTDPTKLGYVALLLGVSIAVGYVFALLRGWGWIRRQLGHVGFRYQPEASVYARTLLRLPQKDSYIIVVFKDGRRVAGMPKFGPGRSDDGPRELYLTHPEWRWGPGDWRRDGVGLIVNLDEVHHITLEDAPR
jgi:hypothetical protein